MPRLFLDAVKCVDSSFLITTVSAAVQIYYGYRIWFLSGSRPLMGLVVLVRLHFQFIPE